MPIYEYECNSCNSKFECIVFSENEVKCCKYCKSYSIKRLITSCNFVGSKKDSNISNLDSSSSCNGCVSSSCVGCK